MAPQLITLFRRGDPAVISVGNFAMRAQCITMVLIPLWTISNMTFQVLGKSRKASVLSAARQGIFFLPLIIILPHIIGLKGVQLTQPIADILTFILSAYYTVYKRTKQKLQIKKSSANAEDFYNQKRVMGIEPTYLAWKASVLPLNYTRIHFTNLPTYKLVAYLKYMPRTGIEPVTRGFSVLCSTN